MNQQHSAASGRKPTMFFVDIVPESKKPISKLFLKSKLRKAGIGPKFELLMQGGGSKYITFAFASELSEDEKYRLVNFCSGTLKP